MIGDELVIGTTIHRLDNKGRLAIPRFANPEDKEKVILVNEGDFYRLYSLGKVLDVFENITGFMPKTPEEIKIVKRLSQDTNLLTLDSAGRMNLGTKDKSCTIIGEFDRLVIIPESTDKDIDYPKKNTIEEARKILVKKNK